MKLDDRGRRAAEGVNAAVRTGTTHSSPEPVERFQRYRNRADRRRRVGTVLATAAITLAATVLLTRAFAPRPPAKPAVPAPLGGLIVYGKWNPNFQVADWFTERPDGSGQRDLHLRSSCVVWWPDGSRLLITEDEALGPGHPLRPATVLPDGSGLRRLDATTDPRLNLGCGDVAPDGARIVLEGFNDQRPGLKGIYAVRASDGGGLVRLTRGFDAVPAFSPDGREIVFMRTKAGVIPNGAGALFVMRADGTGLRRITPWGSAFLNQGWSPDGRWIVFQKPYGLLYLVHPDGTGLDQIPIDLPAGSGGVAPSWSPDGSRIVFSLQGGERWGIYTVRPDGSDLQQVTNVPDVNETLPDWGTPLG
jgi:hypothetical protein